MGLSYRISVQQPLYNVNIKHCRLRIPDPNHSSALSLALTCLDLRPLTVTGLSLAETVRLRGPDGFERPPAVTEVVVVALLGPEYRPP